MALVPSVSMIKLISVFVDRVTLVLNVSFTILNSINVTSVCREASACKVIQLIATISFVFVHRVIKDIDVNSTCRYLAPLLIHYLLLLQYQSKLSISPLSFSSSWWVFSTISVHSSPSNDPHHESLARVTIYSSPPVSIKLRCFVYSPNSFRSLLESHLSSHVDWCLISCLCSHDRPIG